MAAQSTKYSVQHAMEDLVLGSRAVRTTPQAGTLTSVTIPTAGANAWTSTTATLTGAVVGDIILISGPTVALSHLAQVQATITAADTVTISGLGDGTGFTGAAKTYNYVLFKQS